MPSKPSSTAPIDQTVTSQKAGLGAALSRLFRPGVMPAPGHDARAGTAGATGQMAPGRPGTIPGPKHRS